MRVDLETLINEYNKEAKMALTKTTEIGKIEVEHGERTYGKSGYTLMKMLQLWSNMSTSFSIFPLSCVF